MGTNSPKAQISGGVAEGPDVRSIRRQKFSINFVTKSLEIILDKIGVPD
jgi:hypothetical protein